LWGIYEAGEDEVELVVVVVVVIVGVAAVMADAGAVLDSSCC